jgi:hypothetical protein
MSWPGVALRGPGEAWSPSIRYAAVQRRPRGMDDSVNSASGVVVPWVPEVLGAWSPFRCRGLTEWLGRYCL